MHKNFDMSKCWVSIHCRSLVTAIALTSLLFELLHIFCVDRLFEGLRCKRSDHLIKHLTKVVLIFTILYANLPFLPLIVVGDLRKFISSLNLSHLAPVCISKSHLPLQHYMVLEGDDFLTLANADTRLTSERSYFLNSHRCIIHGVSEGGNDLS